MKKKVFVTIVSLLIVVSASYLIFVNIGESPKISGKIVYYPPQTINCNDTALINIWGSIFNEDSSNIKFNAISTLEECTAIAYKNESTDTRILMLGRYNYPSKNGIGIIALRANLSQNYINSLSTNLSSFAFTELLDILNRTNNNVLDRTINTINIAIFESSLTFKIQPTNFALESGKYTFRELINQNIGDYYYTALTQVQIYSNSSMNLFSFNEEYMLLNCTPIWRQINASCRAGESFISSYNDINRCNIAPNSTYANKTYDCDFDGNGIIGNKSDIKRRNLDIDIYINGTNALNSHNFTNKTYSTEIKEGNTTRIIFVYNFSNPLNLKNISIEKQPSSSNFSYLIVSGLDTQKIIFLNKINPYSSQVCIKNAHIDNILELSNNCNQIGEKIIECPGQNSSFSCQIVNNMFVISGLTSSAAREMLPIVIQPPACISNWSCTNWNSCASSTQSRTCTDINNCNSSNNQLVYSQTCTTPCVSAWQCNNWTACTKNNTQTRLCTDENNCTNKTNKPPISQACKYSGNENIGKALILIIVIFLVIAVAFVVYYIIRNLMILTDDDFPMEKTIYS